MTCSGDLWQRDSPMSWCQETRSHWCWLGWAATLMFSRYLHLHHTGQPPPARQNTLLHHLHLPSLHLHLPSLWLCILSLMTFMSGTQFYIYLLWVNALLAKCLKSVLNVKVVVAAFNQEKAILGAFSVIVKLKTSWRFLYSSTTNDKCILRCCKSAGSLPGWWGGLLWWRLTEAAGGCCHGHMDPWVRSNTPASQHTLYCLLTAC